MATCYNCGKYIEGQGYRREVQTGSGLGVGMRRMNYTARVYYSTRTVCKECADKLDSANIILWIILIALAIAAFVFMFSVTQKTSSSVNYSNTTNSSPIYFDKNSGESLIYSKPSINSKVRGKIKDFNNHKKIGQTKYFDKYEFTNNLHEKFIGYIKKEDL